MDEKIVHEITNQINQIVGYVALLRQNPEAIASYGDFIEASAYRIDALSGDLFQLSRSRPAPRTPAIKRSLTASSALRGKRIMIVDDLTGNRDILEQIFKSFKCEILCLEDARRSLELFDAFDPDLVCMDIVMPELSGDRAARMLREKQSKARFVAVSAVRDPAPDVCAPFDAWLPKPFTLDQLLEILVSVGLCPPLQLNLPLILHPETVMLSDLDGTDRKRISALIAHGALSELERTVAQLGEGPSKRWLQEKVSLMELDTIATVIASS